MVLLPSINLITQIFQITLVSPLSVSFTFCPMYLFPILHPIIFLSFIIDSLCVNLSLSLCPSVFFLQFSVYQHHLMYNFSWVSSLVDFLLFSAGHFMCYSIVPIVHFLHVISTRFLVCSYIQLWASLLLVSHTLCEAHTICGFKNYSSILLRSNLFKVIPFHYPLLH